MMLVRQGQRRDQCTITTERSVWATIERGWQEREDRAAGAGEDVNDSTRKMALRVRR